MKTSRFIARVFGLTGVVLSIAIVASGGALMERLLEAMNDPGILIMTAIMTLLLGIAIVVGHHVWDGSWRVVITVLGYLTVLKGFVLLVWPSALLEISNGMYEGGVMPAQIIFAVVFYGWLMWLGFRPQKGEPSPEFTP
ncbi:MAG: hypothetical protein ABGZ37_08060 [Akkermansiaceae bacterium]|jgi:FtsH-binding integral membrane protein